MADTGTIFAYCTACASLREAPDDAYGNDLLAAWLREHEPHRPPGRRAGW
jgi:hypothetical protein